MQLVKYEAARQALAEANAVDEVKDISDKVEALRAYAKQKNDTEMELWLSEIKVRADRRIGEISKGLEKAKSNQNTAQLPSGGKKRDVLKEAGISTSAANRCEQIAEIPEDEFEQEVELAKETKKPVTSTNLLRKEKEKKREAKRWQKLAQISEPDFEAALSEKQQTTTGLIKNSMVMNRRWIRKHCGCGVGCVTLSVSRSTTMMW